MKEKYWAIAHDWGDEYPDQSGTLGFYMIHGNDIFTCTDSEAKATLDYVQKNNRGTRYFLVKLKLKVQK